MAQINLGHVVGPGIPSGGTSGQILKKASATNYDTAWMDADQLPEVSNLATDLAAAYNSLIVYQEGDFCTNDTILYKRNSWGADTPVAEAWNSAHWTAVNATDQIKVNRSAIDTLQNEIGIVVKGNKASVNVSSGQYVIVKGSTITGITDGLYTYSGSSTKTAGNSFSSAELTAVSGGGLNALNGKLTLTNLTNSTTIKYYDGRIQNKYINNVEQNIITFDPNGKVSQSYSENGTTFVEKWSVNTSKFKSDDVSLTTQSYYSISSGTKCQYSRIGSITIVNACIKCDTPYTTYPGVKIIENLPGRYNSNDLYYSFASLGDNAPQKALRLILDGNGNLYARYGETNAYYDINIVFLCE